MRLLSARSVRALHRPLRRALRSARAAAPPAPSLRASASAGHRASSWLDVGVCPSVTAALTALGCGQPTAVQAAAAPPLLAGRHTVLTAETGGGKTYAYLAPLASALAARGDGGGGVRPPSYCVLVPNAMLAAQVVAAANALKDVVSGERLLPAAALGAGRGLRAAAEDRARLVVSTPATLMVELFGRGSGDAGGGGSDAPDAGWGGADGAEGGGSGASRRLSRHVLERALEVVVADEADMLLSGGFERLFKKLIQLLDAAESECGAAAAAEHALPLTAAEEAVASTAAHASARKRQYVFAAATMHASGRCTPGEVLRLGFPEAEWVTTTRLHRSAALLQHVWRDVAAEDDAPAVADALQRGWAAEQAGAGTASTDVTAALVFCNTAAGASRLAASLADEHGIACLPYGAEQGGEARRTALAALRAGHTRVLVCTDAASRGLDVPSVTHVVQAGFAPSAVDFLHRAGRTCRSVGAAGRLTSLVAPHSQRLAAAVRRAVEAGGDAAIADDDGAAEMEAAFSRKRSFTKKFKKYGQSREGTPDPAKAAAMAEREAARQQRIASKQPARMRAAAATAAVPSVPSLEVA